MHTILTQKRVKNTVIFQHPYERLDYYYNNFYRPYYGGFPFGGYTLGSIYKPY